MFHIVVLSCPKSPKINEPNSQISSKRLVIERSRQYLMMDIGRKERSYMAQFRLAILPLRIETGRYRGEDIYERVCTMRDTREVEDEMHICCFHAQCIMT